MNERAFVGGNPQLDRMARKLLQDDGDDPEVSESKFGNFLGIYFQLLADEHIKSLYPRDVVISERDIFKALSRVKRDRSLLIKDVSSNYIIWGSTREQVKIPDALVLEEVGEDKFEIKHFVEAKFGRFSEKTVRYLNVDSKTQKLFDSMQTNSFQRVLSGVLTHYRGKESEFIPPVIKKELFLMIMPNQVIIPPENEIFKLVSHPKTREEIREEANEWIKKMR